MPRLSFRDSTQGASQRHRMYSPLGLLSAGCLLLSLATATAVHAVQPDELSALAQSAAVTQVPSAVLPPSRSPKVAMPAMSAVYPFGAREAQRVELPELSDAERAQLAAPSDPPGRQRVGLWRAVPPVDALPLLQATGDGAGVVSYYQLRSPGAQTLRIALLPAALEAGVQVLFLGPEDAVFDHYLAADSESNAGALHWSARIPGEVVTVEVRWPSTESVRSLSAWLPQLSHRVVREPVVAMAVDCDNCELRQPRSIGASEACQIDIACQAEWQPEADGVARMNYEDAGGSFNCTGTLLNEVNESGTPYFLSANHCFSTQAAASTLITDWFFQASACGSGLESARTVTVQGGATLLTADAFTDTLLLRLNAAPPTGARYQGWTLGTPTVGAALTALHHPSADLKKISRGQLVGFSQCTDTLAADGYECFSSDPSAADAQFLSVQFSQGATETGSSGSGLFTDDTRQLIGVLLGGSDSCTNPEGTSDYGRFERAYARNSWAQWLNTSSGPDSDGDGIEDRFDPYPNDPINDTSERQATAWQVGEIYLATLGRAMDAEGLNYWTSQVDNDDAWTPRTVAQSFFDQPEVAALYPPSATTADFVTALYRNVLNRAPDTEGFNYWVNALDTGALRRDDMVVAMINGAWSNAEAFRNGDVARFRNLTLVSNAFAAFQTDNNIVFSQLSTAGREQLLSASASVLANVSADASSVSSAIASISGLLAGLGG